MLRFTELVYLAAPFGREEESAFNRRLAKLVRAYNYPLFLPEEARVEITRSGCLEDWQPGPELLENGCHLENPEAYVTGACMDALNRANLVIAVFYGEAFDPLTAFEVGYALGRRTNVVAVRNGLIPDLFRTDVGRRLAAPQVCSRVVVAPETDDCFPDRLIPILNRYFVPHKL